MLFSSQEEFCDATAAALVSSSDDLILGNVIDLQSTTNYPGAQGKLRLVVKVNTAFTSDGSATVNFKLCSDSTANLATSKTTHLQSGAIAVASLTAGATIMDVCLPDESFERYLGMWHTVAAATLTAGKVDAFLTSASGTWRAFPNAI